MGRRTNMRQPPSHPMIRHHSFIAFWLFVSWKTLNVPTLNAHIVPRIYLELCLIDRQCVIYKRQRRAIDHDDNRVFQWNTIHPRGKQHRPSNKQSLSKSPQSHQQTNTQSQTIAFSNPRSTATWIRCDSPYGHRNMVIMPLIILRTTCSCQICNPFHCIL